MQRRGAGTALAHVVVTGVDVLVGGQGLNVGQVLAGVDDDLLRPVLDQVVQHQQGLQNNGTPVHGATTESVPIPHRHRHRRHRRRRHGSACARTL